MKDKVKRGFTLIEVVITLAIFSIIIGAIHQVFVVGQRAWDSDLSLLDLQQSARRGLYSVAREIRAAKLGSISISESDTKIEFDTPGENNIQFFLNSDDGQLVRESPAGTDCDVLWDEDKCRVLAIDITDVYFSLTGGIVEVRLVAEKTVWGRTLSFPLSTKLEVRND